MRQFLQELIEQEATGVLGRLRHGRGAGARVRGGDGGSHEFRGVLLPCYPRLTGSASALIAGADLAGMNTRRVRLALGRLFVNLLRWMKGPQDAPLDEAGPWAQASMCTTAQSSRGSSIKPSGAWG